jgi:hypothetical protein
MNCYEIIMLIFTGGTAIGTLSLAYFAFSQIRHVVKEQQLKRKNEIIEFSKSAIEWDFTIDDNTYLKGADQYWIATKVILQNHINRVTDIMRTGHIISNTLTEARNAGIKRLTDKTLTELMTLRMQLIDLINSIDFTAVSTPSEFIENLDKVGVQKGIVDNASESLFGEVAKREGI